MGTVRWKDGRVVPLGRRRKNGPSGLGKHRTVSLSNECAPDTEKSVEGSLTGLNNGHNVNWAGGAGWLGARDEGPM